MNNDLQELLAVVEIGDILDREGVDYRETTGSRGPQFWVKDCPRCGNSNWKVYLNQETGLGNCFSGDCEETFNKWKFAAAILGTDNRDTYKYIADLAKEVGWKPRVAKPAPKAAAPKAALELPKCYKLPIGGKNIKFLANKGITSELAAQFDLRYSKDGVYWYHDADGEMRMQNYEQRVIIPIYDEEGQLVSFQGRDITGTKDQKYLFPPAYPAHDYFYHEFMFSTAKPKRLVINEGSFDVTSATAALKTDPSTKDVLCVGSLGKHLTLNQLDKLRRWKGRGLSQVTMMWDGEPKAAADALKAAEQITMMGIEARVAFLPKGQDPNESTPKQVREAFQHAMKWSRLGSVLISKKIKSMYST